MGRAVPQQHPAVVLRSHYQQLRALLAIAMVAVVGLSAAVVIVAVDDDAATVAGSATQVTAPSPAGTTRYDGGPEEGTRGVIQVQRPGAAAVRYDGGPEEGTRNPLSSSAEALGTRYDGGPDEGTRGAGH
jgi:hypothetical protein